MSQEDKKLDPSEVPPDLSGLVGETEKKLEKMGETGKTVQKIEDNMEKIDETEETTKQVEETEGNLEEMDETVENLTAEFSSCSVSEGKKAPDKKKKVQNPLLIDSVSYTF